MNIDLEKALRASMDIIYGVHSFHGFKDYDSVYFVTSESIKDYLEAHEFLKNRALTILSGGDQVFNLIASGVYEIDAFDSNKLTYFVYYLRKAMLNTFSFQDFKRTNVIFTSACNDFSNHLDILEEVKLHLPEEVYEYYRKMIEFSKNNPMVNFESLYYTASEIEFSRNNYLVSEDTYKALQKSVNDANVNITFTDALTFSEELTSTYDIILLSNIADYFTYSKPEFGLKEFKKFITSYMKILNPNGILIHYLYNINQQNPIRNLPITKEDLGLNNIYPVTTPIFRNVEEGYYLERKPKIKWQTIENRY